MNVLLKSVLSLSFSGALLICLLFLCKPLFRDRISKRWQYYMWLVVIARLLVPFSLSVSPVNILFQEVDRATVQITAISGENDTHTLQAAGNAVAIILNDLWLVWLVGAFLLLIRKITIYQGFVKYIKAGCSEVSDIDILNRLAQYEEQAGVKKPVELCVNRLVSSPLLIGFFRPCIVLPTVDLPDSDFRYTILHELTHYRHRDMFYKWVVQITLCIHWFNPLAYLMCHEINRACELACDETIISTLEAKERAAYGDTLLNAIGIGGSFHNSIASMTLYENKKMIKERLGAIMNFKKKSIWVMLGSFVLVIGLFAVSTVLGAYAAPAAAEDSLGANVTSTNIANDTAISGLSDVSLPTEGAEDIPESDETVEGSDNYIRFRF